MQQIVYKHLGLDAIIDMILARMGQVQQIVVLGDYANGIDSGVIEVLIVGKQLNADYIDQLALKIEDEIKRKVVFTLQDFPSENGLIIYENFEC